MSTIRLYQHDRYQISNISEVCDVKEKNGCDAITCKSSVFFPEGGGQPSDTGTVTLGDSIYKVTSAHDNGLESDVWHYTDAPSGTFHAGDSVKLAIDWDLRFRNMQRHCGEHMLSGTMHSLFGGINKGFHMGEDYITIDIDLGGRMLTGEELDLAERTVNEAIWSGLPVTVTWFEDYESSRIMPVRKSVPHDGRISVVTVGDVNDPYDCIACCGTHPASSAEVGLLAIYKCEPNKGMNRIFFDCGRMAMARLTEDSHILAEAAKRYSCSARDLPARLDKEAASVAELKARLAALSGFVRDAEAERILADIAGSGSEVYQYSSDILSTDELLKLGFTVLSKTSDRILVFTHPESRTCLLFSSGSFKCGQFIKAHASEFGGRGGGRDDNARAIFSDAGSMRRFASAVEEML